MAEPQRDRILSGLAICFWLLAISNFFKPFQLSEQTGFVLFGTRLTGTDNVIWSLVFGAYLTLYGLGPVVHEALRRRHVAPPTPCTSSSTCSCTGAITPPSGSGGVIGAVLYSVIAIGASVGAAVLLSLRRKEFSW